ncbi:MAG TPA: hypothetical protein PLD20_31550 [Blastocatellia bacterium]|nr:hypothetical protein [Blastocatellia bacterium]HMV85085.1 hypothetical protein [Blastocatellia bacterium]HMX26205.1 hypothetical protein [Blastocatellia bacterium]HMY71800.1 hypothetical protein [Blastocatellia bacterium]HMZ22508.1 hypothetical protein [Blastocatellia bacterium]
MSGAENQNRQRWTYGLRVIPGVVPRAQIRNTLTYRFHPRFTAGIEVNPRAKGSAKVNPIANLLLLTETGKRPALIVGTSSDRIGTPDGQSFYATLSKNLKEATGLPIAPYAGVAYSMHDERFLPVAGLNVYFTERFSSLVIFDGVRVHPLLNYARGRHIFSFVLANSRHPGVSYSISF